MQPIELPTLLFWKNGNTWYGSKGQARFFIQPQQPGEGEEVLKVRLWRGLTQLTGWLEERAAELNR